MSWPKGIYVATVNNGVYYCSDFVDPSTQPTWATVNTGLANVGCREFKLDPFNPENKQYVLTESDRILYRRDNQGNWASILTPAEANTLLSDSGLTINSFCVDESIAGRLWALVGAGGDILWAIYSDDYGATWNTTATAVHSGAYLSGIGLIRAYGNNVFVSTAGTLTANTWVKYSYDKGATWSYKELASGWDCFIAHNPAVPGRVYCTDGSYVIMHIDAGSLTSTNGFVNSSPPESSHMWFDTGDADHQRSFYGGDILETDDNWSTYDSVTPSIAVINIGSIYSGDIGQMLVGLVLDTYQPHTVGAMAEFGTGVAGISGSMPGTSPYTNSIPKTCGGVCTDGVQGVRALGNVYAHGVAMPGYAGADRGTPLAGDRSAWDAENYPERHANDTNTAGGIHHTIGTGANQAASGAHTVDTNNPHSVSKVQLGDKLDATTAPTVNDDSSADYIVGSLWVDVTNDKYYVCLDATVGAAVWQELGAGGGGGDISGPGSSTDNAIARWNGTGGDTLQNSGPTISDNGKVTIPDSGTEPPLNVTERSSAPSSPATGDLYLDDGTNTATGSPGWRRYTGAAWEDVGATGGGGTDANAIHDNVASEISAISEKASPVSADLLIIEDSENSYNKKKVQIGNLPAGSGGSSYYDPDNPPSSPGTYDDEFNDESIAVAWSYSAADASFDYDQTSGTPHISESLMPGYLVMQADTISKAFTPSITQAFTLVVKFNLGINFSVNESWGKLYIEGQSSSYNIEVRVGRYNNADDGYRLIGANGGAAAEWANVAGGGNTGPFYIAISHDGSKNINVWGSHDGKAWTCIERARSISNFTSFTSLEIAINSGKAGDSADGIAIIDFVRYFETADHLVIGS